MPLEALIFDVDGTLAETEELHRQAFNETFARFGLDWSWSVDLYRKLLKVTGGKERIRHYVEAWQPQRGSEALGQLGELHAEKTRRYTALVAEGALKPRPGVLRLLHEGLAADVKLAIATTTSGANIEALLRASFAPDALSWFAVIGAGDAVPAKKPAPDIYRYVLKGLGCDPSHCIAFEDSENGIRSARAAGLAVVATPSVYTEGDDFSGARVVLSDLGEEGQPFRQLVGKKLSGGMVTLMDLRDLAGRSEPA
ncbi:MAG: HAD family hydrolase, partial [Methylovirgula sp.]